MMIKLNHFKELEQTGSVRLYQKDGYEVYHVLEMMDSLVDHNRYSYGLIENEQEELFIEVIKY